MKRKKGWHEGRESGNRVNECGKKEGVEGTEANDPADPTQGPQSQLTGQECIYLGGVIPQTPPLKLCPGTNASEGMGHPLTL